MYIPWNALLFLAIFIPCVIVYQYAAYKKGFKEGKAEGEATYKSYIGNRCIELDRESMPVCETWRKCLGRLLNIDYYE